MFMQKDDNFYAVQGLPPVEDKLRTEVHVAKTWEEIAKQLGIEDNLIIPNKDEEVWNLGEEGSRKLEGVWVNRIKVHELRWSFFRKIGIEVDTQNLLDWEDPYTILKVWKFLYED